MPSFNGPKVEYISSLNEVNYPGPCQVLLDGQQPTAEDIKSFPGKIFVLRGVSEQEYTEYLNKLNKRPSHEDIMATLAVQHRKLLEHERAEEAKKAKEAAKLAKNRASGGDQRSEKAKPNKTMEAGDCGPIGAKSGKDDYAEMKKKLRERQFARIVYVLGRADSDPAFSDRLVVFKYDLYLLHKDAKEQDIAVFADKAAEFLEEWFESRVHDHRLKGVEAAAKESLNKIASLRMEKTVRFDDGAAGKSLEQVFFATSRANFDPTKKEVKLAPPKHTWWLLHASASDADPWTASVESLYGRWADSLTKILLDVATAAHPDRAVIFFGKLFVINKDAKVHDVRRLINKQMLIRYKREHKKEPEDKIRLFEADTMMFIASMATLIDDYGTVQLEDATVTEKISTIRFGALRCKYEPSEKEVESNVDSREDDEYEEVGKFGVVKRLVVRSANGDYPEQKYVVNVAETAYTLGRADYDPAFPCRCVVFERKYYMLHKDAKEQDIAVFADRLGEYVKACTDCNTDDDSELDRLEGLNAGVLDSLGKIASLTTEKTLKFFESEDVQVESVFFGAFRGGIQPSKKEVELNVESNEDDEYEEVGNFCDIKCKCVIC